MLSQVICVAGLDLSEEVCSFSNKMRLHGERSMWCPRKAAP